MNLLLLSNSTNYQEAYLGWAADYISKFLENKPLELLFIPYAGVGLSADDYTAKVAQALKPFDIQVTGIHTFENPKQAVLNAKAIAVGGGNTFYLLHQLYQLDLVSAIKQVVEAGVPYIGWSAGSNVAGKTIKTTNDMPIVEPKYFTALGLVPFQINPHFTDKTIPNHGGESRRQRLMEFLEANPKEQVLGLEESTLLMRKENSLQYVGKPSLKLFRYGEEVKELAEGEISHLLP